MKYQYLLKVLMHPKMRAALTTVLTPPTTKWFSLKRPSLLARLAEKFQRPPKWMIVRHPSGAVGVTPLKGRTVKAWTYLEALGKAQRASPPVSHEHAAAVRQAKMKRLSPHPTSPQ